ncbi:hypothetical protein Hypma_011213 [Hypsizygus marmoreus]|uniref:Formamidase n=1 Tax=Hypsizygus marmoreus TaxID=39966 RepID=A0A369JII4_HYPMA|nr:hypothetical protein Hypma_011213 [Hypsizygus marmoreus]
MSIHSVRRHQCNLAWDNSIAPVAHVESGDTVTFDCIDASNGQVQRNSTVASISNMIFEQLDPVHGPVFIKGALPGDTLQIDILDVETAGWGWTGLIPGFGLLADEFTEPGLKIWKFTEDNKFAWFDEAKGIKVPLRPFPGEIGLARGVPGAFSTIPPYNTGGNVDTKFLSAGSTLYLPVEVEGGLLSVGDGHAAQGDGGTAIETPMKLTVRVTVRKDRPYTKTPHFRTVVGQEDAGDYYATTGIEPDIRDATRSAVHHMIEFLVQRFGIDRKEAYILCSVAGDLRMHEVVDMPNFVVGMLLPRSLFPADSD